MSSVYSLLVLGRAGSAELVSTSFNDAAAALSSLSRRPKCFGSSSLGFLLSGAASRKKFDTNRLKILHTPE